MCSEGLATLRTKKSTPRRGNERNGQKMDMKRIISLCLAAVMLLSAVACGSKEPATPALKEGVTLQGLMDSISEEYGFAMPAALDEMILTDLLDINPGDVEEYAGYISMVMVSSDNLIAVKAKEGKTEEIQGKLEARKDFEVRSFQQYLPDQYDKAQAGKVFAVGDYVFLVMVAGEDGDPAADIAAAETLIRDSFAG